jgi:hypothetical protein
MKNLQPPSSPVGAMRAEGMLADRFDPLTISAYAAAEDFATACRGLQPCTKAPLSFVAPTVS